MKTIKTPRISLRGKRTVRQILTVAFALAVTFTAGSVPAGAVDLQSTVFYSGTMDLINDLMTAAMIASPLIGGLFAVYYLTRRGMADEQDGKTWNKRMYTAIGCGVGAGLVTGIIALITSYYTA